MPERQRAYRDQRLAEPPPMRLMERDIDILQAVYEYRTLTTDQIQTLFFTSLSQAYDRLHMLYHNAYVNRILQGVHADKMSKPMLYVLDKRGIEILRRKRGIEVERRATLKGVTFQFLEHTLAINWVRIAVTKAAIAEGFKLVKWIGENELKSDYDYVSIRTDTGRMKQVSVIPDGYFVLETPRGITHCCIEVDTGMETVGVFKKKVLAYQAYYHGGGYEGRFGAKSLRVLTITDSPKRLINLVKMTEENAGKQRFWYTTQEQISSKTVLTEPIWKVATKEGLSPLIRLDSVVE